MTPEKEVEVTIPEVLVPFVFTPELPERNDEVVVKIQSPDSQGRVEVKFSREIRLPTNFTSWTDQNEGAERLRVQYLPTNETKVLVEEMDVYLKCSWKIATV